MTSPFPDLLTRRNVNDMNTQPTSDPHTLGYWVRLVDRLLELRLEHLLAADLLSRSQWQILSIIRHEPLSEMELETQLLPFIGGSEIPLRVHLDDLFAAGWIRKRDGRFYINENRLDLFEATDAKVQRMRRAVVAGIGSEEYYTVMNTLERIAGNLGWDERSAA